MKLKRFTYKKTPSIFDDNNHPKEALHERLSLGMTFNVRWFIALIFAFGWQGKEVKAQGILNRFEQQFRKIQPPNGKCIESTLPLIEISKMNGQLNADTVDFEDGQETFRQWAIYNSNSVELTDSLWKFRDSIQAGYIRQNILPMTLMDFSFKTINDTLKQESRVLFNEQDSVFEFNLDDYSRSLYQNKSCFALALPMQKIRNDF